MTTQSHRSKEERRASALKNPWWEDPERMAARVAKMKANENWIASTSGRFKGGKTRVDGRVDVYWRGKYRPRARVVMEQHLGRALLSSEHVHHVNEDCTDDRVENLRIVSRSEHTKIHRIWRKLPHGPCEPGCKCGRHGGRQKLTDVEIASARKRIASGERQDEVAADLGVSVKTLYNATGSARKLRAG